MLSVVMKTLMAATTRPVQIVVFTPKPRLTTLELAPADQEPVVIGDSAVGATRYRMRPQRGLFASLLVADVPDIKCWIAVGEAPAFLRAEGPLYFLGPVWRIDTNESRTARPLPITPRRRRRSCRLRGCDRGFA